VGRVESKRIAIIGGHGKVALLLAPLLVAAGDEVTAIHRNPAHTAEVEASGARGVDADDEALGLEHNLSRKHNNEPTRLLSIA
jgi:putative NADH-flavin reductase